MHNGVSDCTPPSSGSSHRSEIKGLRVRDLLESASWSCVGAQVKDRFHVVMWTACKRRSNNMNLDVDFGHIHGNAYTLAAALSALV